MATSFTYVVIPGTSNCKLTGLTSKPATGATITFPSVYNSYNVTQVDFSAYNYTLPRPTGLIFDFSSASNLQLIATNSFTSVSIRTFIGQVIITSNTGSNASSFEISDSAFSGCLATGNLIFNSKLTRIGSSAFLNCTKLTFDMTNATNLQTIGVSAFSGCSNISAVNLSTTKIITIPDYAFYNCSKVTSLILHPDTTSIGFVSFAGMSSLTAVTLTSKLQTIGNSAFSGCTSLVNLDMSNTPSLINIGNSVFSGCSKLVGNFIFNSLQIFNNTGNIFFNCSSLTSITNFDAFSMSTIPKTFFSNCSALFTSLKIPSSVLLIDNNAFENCSSLTTLDMNNVETIGTSCFSNCFNLASVNLRKVKQIGARAFYGCSNLLGGLILGSTVTSVGINTFNSSGLSSVDFSNTIFTSIDNGVLSNCPNLEYVYGLNNIKTIKVSSFSQCTNLKSVYGLDNVTDIGDSAFQGCTTLSLDLRSLTKLASIGRFAFAGCSNLSNPILVPNSLTYFTTDSFNSPTSLKFFCQLNQLINIKILSGVVSSVTVPNSLTFDGANSVLSGTLSEYGENLFTLVDTNGTLNISFFIETPPDLACFMDHSKILMGNNEYVEIRKIKKGDMVVSAFTHTPVLVKHCGKIQVSTSSLDSMTLPYRIPAHYFGQNKPSDDVILSGTHRLLLKCGENKIIGVQLFKLGIGKPEEIIDPELDYYHIELDNEPTDGVIVSGIGVESLEHGDWEKLGFSENIL